MIKKLLFLFIITLITIATVRSQTYWPSGLTGRWTFDNMLNPTQATVGSDLQLVGFQIPIPGPVAGDNAVRLGQGSYYRCFHNIAANGGGAMVNRYSLLVDFRIKQFGMWRCFYQTDTTNSSDGEVFINPTGNIGVSATGYSGYSVLAGQWYRMVITTDLTGHYDYYLDGKLLLTGAVQTLDGRFSLYPQSGQNEFFLFADNDGEDNVMDVAQVAIFNHDLSAVEIDSLGGFGHVLTTHQKGINTYLQTPTPTSMYISWHSVQTSSTLLQYGTTAALGFTASGSYEAISTKTWHTVKLSGLIPDTHYYYRAISGTDTSQVYEFRTPFTPGTPGKHLRFAMMGDSQNDINMPAIVSNAMEQKFSELYGANYVDSISLMLHIGDLTQDGNAIDRWESEYFNPFGNLTHSIPNMSCIGNHEGESNYYYSYMKYEDVSDYAYPNTLCERYYNFTLGNCQFIELNTNGLYNDAAQLSWLHNKLNQSNVNPAIDFVFTFNHEPGHSEIWPDGNTGYVLNTIQPELESFPKMMLDAYGHSHNYERGVLKTNHGEPQDMRILCMGGAGAPLDRWLMYTNQTDYPEIHRAMDIYHFIIVDVNIDNKSYTATMYSLGNPDKRVYNIKTDSWYYKANQSKPAAPHALSPSGMGSVTPTMTASPLSGIDSLMSSQFQLTATPGDYSSPLIDSTRNWEDLFMDSGAPYYTPIDVNAGIDLKRLSVLPGVLQQGHTYGWRVRYRDFNIKWSSWSNETTFTANSTIADSAMFVADTTHGAAALTVHFTDLSTNTPTAWSWDLDGDGITDSQLRDPVFTYTTDGLYTVSLTTHYGTDSSTSSKYQYINVGSSIGIADVLANNPCILVYPNPALDYVTVDIKSKDARIYVIELYNNLNQLIASQMLLSGENNVILKNIHSGFYTYRIRENGRIVKVDKMVVQN